MEFAHSRRRAGILIKWPKLWAWPDAVNGSGGVIERAVAGPTVICPQLYRRKTLASRSPQFHQSVSPSPRCPVIRVGMVRRRTIDEKTSTTEEALDHAASYQHGQALEHPHLRQAGALPALRRRDGCPLYVRIRRERRNPPSLGMRRLRATLQHLDPAHHALIGGSPELAAALRGLF